MATRKKAPDEKQKIRARYEADIGKWQAELTPVLEADPAVTGAFVDFARVPFQTRTIERKYQELILLAVNASATHLYRPAIQAHMAGALQAGATTEEILEALEMTSVIGMHTCSTGMPILFEELAAAGVPVSSELSRRQQQVKDNFMAARGWWSEFLDKMLLLQPELLDAYVRFSAVPWQRGKLPAKIKELIYIAIDSQTTHLYEVGLRSHIRNALKLGATAAEITEVFALISGLGFHTMTVAVPILNSLAKRRPSRSKMRPAKRTRR